MKNWHALVVSLITLSVMCLGCGTTKMHRVITGTPGPAHSGPVLVVMQGMRSPPYEEIAIVQAVGQGSHADLEHVVAGMKKEAQKLGCTALINVKVDQGSGTASGTGICARIVAKAPISPAPPHPPPVVSEPPASEPPPPPPESPPDVDESSEP